MGAWAQARAAAVVRGLRPHVALFRAQQHVCFRYWFTSRYACWSVLARARPLLKTQPTIPLPNVKAYALVPFVRYHPRSPGILSSYGELAHMASGAAGLEPLDPFKPKPKMSYKDGYQKRWAVRVGRGAAAVGHARGAGRGCSGWVHRCGCCTTGPASADAVPERHVQRDASGIPIHFLALVAVGASLVMHRHVVMDVSLTM